MLTERKARSQRRVCWRGVAQAGSPGGGWGGHWETPGGTSWLPGTPPPCPACRGTAWLRSPLGYLTQSHCHQPWGDTASHGDTTTGTRLPWGCHIAGWQQVGMWSQPWEGVSALASFACVTDGLVELLLANPPLPCTWGAAGTGVTGLGSVLPRPLLGHGGGGQAPLTPTPLCPPGQDYGLSRSPPQFGSIYHVRGNGTPRCPLPWGGGGGSRGCSASGRTRLSQCQTGAASHSRVPLLASAPMGPAVWVCTLGGCWGGSGC